MNTLLLADRALADVIRRLEHLHRQVRRRVARSDDQRHFIIDLERIEDQVAAAVKDSDGPRRIFDASNLIKDLRKAKAKAHNLGFSRKSARTVDARIKSATSTILVDVFDLDPHVLEDLNQRNQFRRAMNRLTVKDAFGPVDPDDLLHEPWSPPWRRADADEIRNTMYFPDEYKTQEKP